MNNIIVEIKFSDEDRSRLDRIAELLGRTAAPVMLTQKAPETTETAKDPETVKEPTPEEKAAEEPQEAPEKAAPVPDRRTVKSLAVKKIQAGHRDDVKALIQAYGAEKLDLVPEDKLAAFADELEKIGG